MPGPRYERVPLEEENLPPINNSYFHSPPSTGPLSFRTIPLDQQSFTPSLPHRHDENAATIMPRNERHFNQGQDHNQSQNQNQNLEDDAPISLWGASESTTTTATTKERDAESMKEDILIRLLNVVERLEERLGSRDATPAKEEPDIEALTKEIEHKTLADQRKKRRDEIVTAVAFSLFVIIFLVWMGAIIIIPAVARYKYAGAIVTASAAGMDNIEDFDTEFLG